MKTLYHTTRRKHRESILEKGLLPFAQNGSIIKYPPRIYLTEKKADIATMDFLNQWDDIDIWEVKIPEDKLQIDTFSHLDYHFFITNLIPSKDLKLVQHISY